MLESIKTHHLHLFLILFIELEFNRKLRVADRLRHDIQVYVIVLIHLFSFQDTLYLINPYFHFIMA